MKICLYPSYKYDIATSYSSKDREIVDAFARYLKYRSIHPYYDSLEEMVASMWNKQLSYELARIYREDAAFCIIFVLENWKKSIHTQTEYAAAMERLVDQEDYIRLIRLDDSDIESLSKGRVYLDARPGQVFTEQDILFPAVFRALVENSERTKEKADIYEIDRFIDYLRQEESRKKEENRQSIRSNSGYKQPKVSGYFDTILPAMLEFKGQEAAAVGATVHFVVTSKGGGIWTLRLKPPKSAVLKDDGVKAEIDLTIKIVSAEMINLLQDTFDARQALIEGNVELNGDLTILNRIAFLFQPSSSLETTNSGPPESTGAYR